MKKFFEGLSLSSIVAGTLAAVTSFLLASKIGIAGSVIGAAASYIVSAVATKIYQNILTASGEKLQSASSSGNDDDTTDNKSDKAAESESDTTMTGMVNTVSTARKPREVVSNRANGRTYSVNELRKARVVPEFLRTLVFARPRGDDQFADCTFSPSLDMSR